MFLAYMKENIEQLITNLSTNLLGRFILPPDVN